MRNPPDDELELIMRETIWNQVVWMTRRGHSDSRIRQALQMAYRNADHRLAGAIRSQKREKTNVR